MIILSEFHIYSKWKLSQPVKIVHTKLCICLVKFLLNSSPISSDLADVTVLDPVPEVLVLAVLADFELLSSATSSFLGSPSFDFFP